jgi:hypothetical protein
MLSKVERYNITLKRSDSGLNPMLSTIFADIEQRGVKNAWDTLAITANTRAYETRSDVKSLTRERRSLSLCLLAQFLLNVEIFITYAAPNMTKRIEIRSCTLFTDFWIRYNLQSMIYRFRQRN